MTNAKMFPRTNLPEPLTTGEEQTISIVLSSDSGLKLFLRLSWSQLNKSFNCGKKFNHFVSMENNLYFKKWSSFLEQKKLLCEIDTSFCFGLLALLCKEAVVVFSWSFVRLVGNRVGRVPSANKSVKKINTKNYLVSRDLKIS